MEYEGPSVDDMDNVRALNRRFLEVFGGRGAAGFGGLGQTALSERQLERLSRAPFLLFSFRESDSDFWQRLLCDDPQLELTPVDRNDDDSVRELTVAALGFLWQLSRRNPFAARVVSGAPVSWCEHLAGTTLMSLLQRASRQPELLLPRFSDQDAVWRRLLAGGVSPKRNLQLMSHQSALQVMLTRATPLGYERLPAAACGIRRPAQRVAERRRRDAPGTEV